VGRLRKVGAAAIRCGEAIPVTDPGAKRGGATPEPRAVALQMAAGAVGAAAQGTRGGGAKVYREERGNGRREGYR
jgi:alkylhydroperoxidase/carboxymuconolactone decarboxylase family protein YurZ